MTQSLPPENQPITPDIEALTQHHDFAPRDPARDQKVLGAMNTALSKQFPHTHGTQPAQRSAWRRHGLAILLSTAACLVLTLCMTAWVLQAKYSNPMSVAVAYPSAQRAVHTVGDPANAPDVYDNERPKSPMPGVRPLPQLDVTRSPHIGDVIVPTEHLWDNTHNETADDMDQHTTRGDLHIPGTTTLSGYGAVGVMGVGGSSAAGAYDDGHVQHVFAVVPSAAPQPAPAQTPSRPPTPGPVVTPAPQPPTTPKAADTPSAVNKIMDEETFNARVKQEGKPNWNANNQTSDPAPREGGGAKKPGTLQPTTSTTPLPPGETWHRSVVGPNSARLMIGDNDELKLNGMQANIHVDGFRARVLIDLYFYNDRAQQFQGTFNLRLPDGASPYYFAFGETAFKAAEGGDLTLPVLLASDKAMNISYRPDRIVADRQATWLQPKEARMVPREKAAFAYRETVYRKKVDPALMEWAGAGVFSARVFPLQAHKLHRIVIGYDVDLARDTNGDLTYRFVLPAEVPSVAVDLSVAALRNADPNAENGGLEVEPSAKPFDVKNYAYFRYDNPKAAAVSVRLKNPGAMLLTGAEAKAEGDGKYFAAQIVPSLNGGEIVDGAADGIFLLDTSLSTNPDKFNVYRKTLQAILTANRPSMHRFKVLLFNVEARWLRQGWMDNTPENVTAVMNDTNDVVLEGASDLSSALQTAGFDRELPVVGSSERNPADTNADFFLLSDGSATWGETNLSIVPAERSNAHVRQRNSSSLFAYLTGSMGNDQNSLQQLANQTGGAVFSIADETAIPAAAVAHRARPWRLDTVTLTGATDLMVAGNPSTLYPGQPLVIVGRGTPAADAAVELSLTQGTATKHLKLPLAHRLDSDLAVRAYGQVAVERIERHAMQAAGGAATGSVEDVAKAYACHFRVTGQTCSLLMLDTEADYARFNIQPDKFNFEIQSTPVGMLVPRTASATVETVATAKSEFVAFVQKLATMPGMQFHPTPVFLAALQAMPEESFYVPMQSLACTRLSNADLSNGDDRSVAYLNALRTGQPTAAQLQTESDRRRALYGLDDALKCYSSRVELNPGDGVTLRETAYAALAMGFRSHAYYLLRRAAVARPFEPDLYLAMAQCMVDQGKYDLAMANFEIALAGQWDGRYGNYQQIVSLCYLDFLNHVAAGQYKVTAADYATARRDVLKTSTPHDPIDLVVIIQWNTDATDVDLHVNEARGEECFFSHSATADGGRLTADVRQGYGPEMYTLPHAPAGDYRIGAHFYAKDNTRASTRTSVYVTILRNFGTDHATASHSVVVLQGDTEMHPIDTLSFK